MTGLNKRAGPLGAKALELWRRAMKTYKVEKTGEVVEGCPLEPIGDRAVVRPLGSQERRIGNIVLPDTVDKEQRRGVVLACGKGTKRVRLNEDDFEQSTTYYEPMTIEPGDTVVFSERYANKIVLDGQEFFVIRENDVLARLKA